MRVVFFGTPRAAVPSLEALRASTHAIAGVVCQPDRASSRGHRLAPPPVKEAALGMGLPVLQPETTRTAAFRQEVAALAPDAFVVVAYGHILGPRLLDLAPRGAFNLHFSLLPRWRGAAPVQRAILAGDALTGVSIIRLVQELDAGPVLAAREIAIGASEHAPELEARLAAAGAGLLVSVLDALAAGAASEVEQDPARVTLAPPLRREEGWLDPGRPAAELARHVRAFDPWPGARLRLPAGVVAVLEAGVAEGSPGAPVGAVTAAPGEDLRLQCADGALLLRRVKPQGRGEMSGRSLLNGRLVREGDVALPPPAGDA